MLHVLFSLKDSIGFSLSCAHVNHGLRGDAADRDEEFVKNLCKELKIPFYSKRYDVAKIAADKKQTVLVVNDTYIYTPINTKNTSLTRSSTFTLPLEKIGEGLDGKVENLSVESGAADFSGRVVNGNYALGKNATVSGLEVDDGRFTADLAFDGNKASRTR